MSRILITGAAGRIGTALTPLLRERGFALRLLDLQPPAAAGPDDEVVLGSVTDEAVLREALAPLDARRGREDVGTSRVAVQHPADRAAAAEPNQSTPTTSRSPGRPPTQRATRPAAIHE